MSRNIFERQWVFRDFKKVVGISAEQCNHDLVGLEEKIKREIFSNILRHKSLFERLIEYFKHQHKLLQGFEKNPDKLKENGDSILNWIRILQNISEYF